nr:ATP-binding protein [uncultured Cohaesibacter sp.]
MPAFQSASLAKPFLTLSAHPTIGAVLLDTRPAWVWNAEGNRILWANAAGVLFFGETSMEALLSRSFGDVHPARRHLARLARNARTDSPTLDKLRFFLGLSPIALSCLCKKLKVGGETVLLVLSTELLEDIEGLKESALNDDKAGTVLLDALAGEKDLFSALLDQDGQVMASSEGFVPFGKNAVALGKLMAKVDEEERFASGSLPFVDSQTDAAIARISDDEQARYLLLVRNPASPLPADEPLGNPFAELESDNQAVEEQAFAEAEADVFEDHFGLNELTEIETRRLDGPDKLQDKNYKTFEADDSSLPPVDTYLDPITGTEVLQSNQDPESQVVSIGSGSSNGASGNVYKLEFPHSKKASSSPRSTHSDHDQSDASQKCGGQHHFVWESDEIGRFKFVSEELSNTVGEENADIIGLTWPEIASRLELDPDGEVTAGFESRDTWASLYVWWPVENRDYRIAVELTGLPIYGNAHGFQGYRGFGHCIPNQRRSASASESIDGQEKSGDALDTSDAEPEQSLKPEASVIQPPFAQLEELISSDLLKAAKNAVTTTTELISPEEPSVTGQALDASVETTGVIAVCEDREKGLESNNSNNSDQTIHVIDEHETKANDGDSAETIKSQRDRVGSLLSGHGEGVKEIAVLAQGTKTLGEGAREDKKLSAGEKHAFEEIANALSDETFESRLPAEDLDEDYEELDSFSDEEEEDQDEDNSAKDDATASELGERISSILTEAHQEAQQKASPTPDTASAPAPAPGKEQLHTESGHKAPVRIASRSAKPEEKHSALPFQSSKASLGDMLKARERRDDGHKSATSKALLEMFAIDPKLKMLHEKASSAKPQPPAAPPKHEEASADEETDISDDAHVNTDLASSTAVETAPCEDHTAEKDAQDCGQTRGHEPLSGADPSTEPAPLTEKDQSAEAAPQDEEGAPILAASQPDVSQPDNMPDGSIDEDSLDEPVVSSSHFVISAFGDDDAFEEDADIVAPQEDFDSLIHADAVPSESSAALTAATVAGVAALNGGSLWDQRDKSSPLIDLLNKLPSAIVVSAKSNVLFASKKALRLLDYASTEAFQAAGGMEGLFEGRPGDWLTKTEGRTTLRRENGAPISVQAHISSINWGDQPAAMLCFEETPIEPPSTGVSEEDEKIAELEAILDTATDGVLVLDREGRILRMNHSAEALFEVDRHKIAGSLFVELLAQESQKDALAYLDRLKSNGLASMLNGGQEIIGQLKSGGLIPLVMTMGRVSIPGTNRFCAVLRDVTEWKRAQEELMAQKLRAEDASKKKSEFLAKVSHEIRTPLNAIIGFSDVMMEERFGAIGQERYKDYLKDIKLSGTHIMSLLNDLLDLSKVEAGKMELHFEAVQINWLVAECVGIMQPQANRSQIIIRTSTSSRLPDVVADRRSLRQIILNILSNAVKFNHAGGQVIVSTTQQESGDVMLRIRDTGIGMSKDEIKQALEPFRQISPTTRSAAEGTGLGLPLTKALTEANKARLNLSSKRDLGTLVEVIFPSERVVEATPEPMCAETETVS